MYALTPEMNLLIAARLTTALNMRKDDDKNPGRTTPPDASYETEKTTRQRKW
jgi:hypothetical protein